MRLDMSDFAERQIYRTKSMIERWNGADAELRELTVSIKTLTLLLYKANAEGNLVISCFDPHEIRAPIRWKNCAIEVTFRTNEQLNEVEYIVSDRNSGAEIVCGAFEVRENVKLW
jgi:hypothetical protein